MKSASTPLKNLLATRQFNLARLYQFSLINGGTLYYTSGDTDVLWGGNTYVSGNNGGLLFDTKSNKAKCHWKVGVEVDTLLFDVLPGANATINGQAFLQAIIQGVFDGAELTVLNAYWPQQAWQTPIVPTGVITVFVGRVAEIDAGRSIATFNVNSHLELLNQNMPRNLYQSGCLNTLYDSACTLNAATYGVSGTALTGSTTSVINATIANATGYFDRGKIIFTSGVNNGVARSVKTYLAGTPGTISLISPFPSAPAIGDTFTIYPGCDKTQATCTAKFNNLANFRGFPYIPINQTGV